MRRSRLVGGDPLGLEALIGIEALILVGYLVCEESLSSGELQQCRWCGQTFDRWGSEVGDTGPIHAASPAAATTRATPVRWLAPAIGRRGLFPRTAPNASIASMRGWVWQR
jgi:hypothetical protein